MAISYDALKYQAEESISELESKVERLEAKVLEQRDEIETLLGKLDLAEERIGQLEAELARRSA